MANKPKKFKWLSVRTLIFGVAATFFTIYWPAVVQDLHSYTGEHELLLESEDAPSYLGDLAPEFSTAWTYKPFGKCDGLFMPTPNFGVDVIDFVYGDNNLDWDIQRDGNRPPVLFLTRHRFGLPMRAAYWDDYGVSGGTAESLKAYFDQVKLRAGKRWGVQYLAWLPCDDGRRLPASPMWIGLFINFIFWCVLYITPGILWRRIRRYRRSRKGLCVVCGYAIEDFDVCPECGSGEPDQSDQAAC